MRKFWIDRHNVVRYPGVRRAMRRRLWWETKAGRMVVPKCR